MTEFKIVVAGGGSVGKSAITVQFTSNHFVEFYDPTIEDSYRKQVRVDDVVSVLDIVDTAGQEEYSCMRDQYFRVGHGFLLVYSVVSRSSFEEIGTLNAAIKRAKEEQPRVPIVLIGNKCDLEERQVTKNEGLELAKHLNCTFVETSAKTGQNIEACFFECVRAIRALNNTSKTGKQKKDKKKAACKVL
eukprot:TRINITY_DN2391_c0_g1_i1.p1 TRINITY_DN2391_c0_g1~~TRINITY_DN2391_c0_g1_i1.p1  ORF type:complete len:204 (-),score=41.82 TRINITY_DN2391_c0_g1_i1:307-873(-)